MGKKVCYDQLGSSQSMVDDANESVPQEDSGQSEKTSSSKSSVQWNRRSRVLRDQ